MLIIIDLETLATGPNAVILSIAASAFSTERGVEPIKFYSKIDLREQETRIIDPDIVTCWMRRAQEDSHAIDLFDGVREPVSSALKRLSAYVNTYLTLDGEVWADGFDCAAIRTLYDEFDLAIPWQNAQHRCVRTLRNLVRQLDIKINVVHDVSSCRELDEVEWNARFILAAIKSLKQRQLDHCIAI